VPTDNVVPIDAEVARSIARRAIRFRWFVAGLTAVWLAALIPVLLFTPLPPLVPFVALGALLVLAEHRFVLFGDETSMSGSIIVAIAAVFFFADTSPFAGPMLVASLGGLYLPQLRDPARFEAWAYRVLVQACYEEGRKTRRWAPNLHVFTGPFPMPHPAPASTPCWAR